MDTIVIIYIGVENNNKSGHMTAGGVGSLTPVSWVNRTFRRSKSAYRPKHIIQVFVFLKFFLRLGGGANLLSQGLVN